MKAQSAIEYLITYGWMLIAVSIISGAVYSMIGVECPESTSGFVGTDVRVDNFGLTADEQELAIALENSRSQTVEIEEISISGEEEVTLETEEDVGPATSEDFYIPGLTDSESCNSLDLEITYSIGTGEDQIEDQRISGTLTSTMEVADVEPPQQPEGFEAIYTGSP